MWLFAQGLSSGDIAACYPCSGARGNTFAAGHGRSPSENTACFASLLSVYGAGSEHAAFHRARARNPGCNCTRGTEQGDRSKFGIDEANGRDLSNQHFPETRSRLSGSGSRSRIGTRSAEAKGKLRTPLFSSSVTYNFIIKKRIFSA